MRRSFSVAALLTVTSLVVAACGPSATTDTTTTSTIGPITTIATTTTTTVPATTTTTIPSLIVADSINGLPTEDPSFADRRTVAVKISNSPEARPQSGLMQADVVYEILVEGGLTRFLAVFQSEDLSYVGPVRSGRPTDAEITKPLFGPFQVSGAQPWVKSIFRAEDLYMVYDTGRTTWRESHRKAPHNLYTNTNLIREFADERGWPDESPGNVFAFGDPTVSTVPATEIVLDWSDHPDVIWRWTGDVYERYMEDEPHMWVTEDGAEEGIVSTPVVVVLTGDRYTARPPGSGTPVPAIATVGTGPANVFMNGTVVEGTWDRESSDVPFRLTDADGDEIILPPSKMFVAIFPDTRSISWS